MSGLFHPAHKISIISSTCRKEMNQHKMGNKKRKGEVQIICCGKCKVHLWPVEDIAVLDMHWIGASHGSSAETCVQRGIQE